MKELLNQLATNRRLKPAHMRVCCFIMAHGPNADLSPLREMWSAQTVSNGVDYLVTLGIIAQDESAKTYSLIHQIPQFEKPQLDTPDFVTAADSPPVEPVTPVPEIEDEKQVSAPHPFLLRPWGFGQRQALQAWSNDGNLHDVWKLAIETAQNNAKNKLENISPQQKEALDYAERFAVNAYDKAVNKGVEQ